MVPDPSHAPPEAVAKPPRQRPLAQWVALAVLGVVVVYVGLFAVSSLRTPERMRVADVSDVVLSFRVVPGQEVSDDYAQAVRLLAEARRSTLRLFPGYDNAALDVAAVAFSEIAAASGSPRYAQEAALALGRIRMAQGKDEDARIALASVVAHSGYRAPEAARLLDYLNAQDAAR